MTAASVVVVLAGCAGPSESEHTTAGVVPAVTPVRDPAYPTFPYGQMDVDYLDIGPERDCGFQTTREPRPDLVGRTFAVVSDSERAVGREARVIGRDGHCNSLRSDLRWDRANVYLVRGVVTRAGMG
jgi:hypothetical protein